MAVPEKNSSESLSAALELEHRQVDDGLAAFLTGLDDGRVDTDGLDVALEALRRHIYLEERILFPPIRHGDMAMPVAVMMCEHGEIWRAMNTLVEVADAGDIDRTRVSRRRPGRGRRRAVGATAARPVRHRCQGGGSAK